MLLLNFNSFFKLGSKSLCFCINRLKENKDQNYAMKTVAFKGLKKF